MPPSHRRRRPSRAQIRRNRIKAGAGVLAVAIAAAAVAVALSSSGPSKHHAGKPVVRLARCPLTDLTPVSGKVPDRPALAVKIGNEPVGARPQSGLNEADVVYDTPAEGFIMRYVALFQCNSASKIGPTRSVRWVDWHLLQPLGHPILAFAGGINPDVAAVNSMKWIEAADLLGSAQGASYRISSRAPPDNLYTSTSALYALFKSEKTPPPSLFSYSDKLPATSTPASSLAIDFSSGTDVLWKWDASSASWLHTYGGTTDIDTLSSKPVSTKNIVVEIVHYSLGPYVESTGGSGDVESKTVGSGSGYVLRGGRAVRVTWHRATLSDPTTFTDAKGNQVALAPGRTWVEIVPDVVAGSISLKG
ncbi:MAG: DUF3048 domain-containing protein [Acidimicrobiales bacterium]